MVVAAGVGAWWMVRQRPGVPPQAFETRLVSGLQKSNPRTDAKGREDGVSKYVALQLHRAMAAPREAAGFWYTGNWPSREIAEERVLEKCLQFFDEPCALISTDDAVVPPGADGVRSVRDAPRVRYAGLFNPERIPALRQDTLLRADVAAYATLPGPKAAAFHATGILHLATGMPNQRDAEEKALKECNADPVRNSSGGPCYLYAAENRVVLPLRLTMPMTPGAALAAPLPKASPPAAAAAASPSPADKFRAALSTAMESIAPAMSEKGRQTQVGLYHASLTHKAIAVHPPSDSWRMSDWPNEADAEQNTLEACQVRYGDPCILLAVNERIQERPSDGNWRRRSMKRVTYDGRFDVQQIPFLRDATRQRENVLGYGTSGSPKAVAVHPWGRIFIVSNAASQFAAETTALADCNKDFSRNGQDGPCLLYAIENQVVLPKRSTSPMSSP